MNRQNIVRSISSSFPTEWHNATRFGVNQILMAITLASVSGISRICRIAVFSGDGLVRALLRLDKAINENAICEFIYQAKSWQRSRVLEAMRSVKEYVEVSYLGRKKQLWYINMSAISAVMNWMPWRCMSCTSSVPQANFAMREANQNLF